MAGAGRDVCDCGMQGGANFLSAVVAFTQMFIDMDRFMALITVGLLSNYSVLGGKDAHFYIFVGQETVAKNYWGAIGQLPPLSPDAPPLE